MSKVKRHSGYPRSIGRPASSLGHPGESRRLLCYDGTRAIALIGRFTIPVMTRTAMSIHRLAALGLVVTLGWSAVTVAAEAVALFNGTDLTGWKQRGGAAKY